jgi:hypothetical protein
MRPTRRRILQWGTAAFGLQLPRLLWAEKAAPLSSLKTPRAKSVIVLYLSGGPSQLDMWDMKPHASEEIRGTFRPISTRVPGTQICEHLPRMAEVADKFTIVRSMTHDEADHLRAGYWVMTGSRLLRPIAQASGMQRNDRPHWAAIAASQLGPRQPELPAFVTVPEYVSPVGVPRPGQHAGFLGARFDPYLIASDPNSRSYNPGPIAAGFRVPPERLSQVETLLGAVEQTTRVPGDSPSVAAFEQVRAEAFDLATSRAAREAFDLSRESEATRDRYGRHTFGQSTLVARRLVEAGVRIVQVNFERHDNGKGGQGYDSHSVPPNPAHLGWTQRELLPPTDAAFAALVEDLADRGLLDETLVVLMGEFGRTPRFNEWGGRDHWPNCYSLVLAGGGIQPGGVYGASDRIGSTPTRDPVGPADLLATVYHLLGIEREQTLRDLEQRPLPLCEGSPVPGLLA